MNPQNAEQRFDNVLITNIADNTVIEGHDAVKKQLEYEQDLLDKYGPSIIFQIYLLDMEANTLEELQGEKLAEIKVDGSFVSETDTVSQVKNNLGSLIKATEQLNIMGPDASITLYCDGRPIQDDTLFYSENPILLPAWIQVLIHNCDSEETIRAINKFRK